MSALPLFHNALTLVAHEPTDGSQGTADDFDDDALHRPGHCRPHSDCSRCTVEMPPARRSRRLETQRRMAAEPLPGTDAEGCACTAAFCAPCDNEDA